MSEYQNQSSVEKLIGQQSDETGCLVGRSTGCHGRERSLSMKSRRRIRSCSTCFSRCSTTRASPSPRANGKTSRRFYTVFTSNIGSSEVMRMTSAPMATVERTVLSRVGQQLRPELVGRITEKLVFARLGFDTQREICELMIERERSPTE
jgi:hypothetical protein